MSNIEKDWLQLEEVQRDLDMLSNEDLVNCRDEINSQIKKAMDYLSSEVRDDMNEYKAD